MSSIVAELLARRGFLQQQSVAVCHEAWREAAGSKMVEFTCPGPVRRGVLEVRVANSTILQELIFQKAAILVKLSQLVPELQVRELRFRVGTIN